MRCNQYGALTFLFPCFFPYTIIRNKLYIKERAAAGHTSSSTLLNLISALKGQPANRFFYEMLIPSSINLNQKDNTKIQPKTY